MKDVSSTGEPTLRGGRVLGCLPELRKDRLGLLLRAQREGGDFVRLRLPGRRLYLASSPETATEVLRTKADEFHEFFALSERTRARSTSGRSGTRWRHCSWRASRRPPRR